MAAINYLDFDLYIGRTQGGYRAQVVNSPAGQASADFGVPFSDLELENFMLRMGQSRRSMRRIESLESEAAKTFGGRLFDAVFTADVRGCLRSSLDEADRQNAGLRIRLRLSDAPELLDLPWEYLYNPSLNRFLALSVESPVVRYLNMPERIKPLTIKPPLKVLVMISSPSDYPPLDVEREWAKLDRVQQNPRLGRVKFVRLTEPTLAALQRCLREDEYHTFHFIGHGGFDQQAQDGVLVLQDENGRGRAVSGQNLGTLLHDERTLRLAVLNACEGGRTSRTDPFAGSAQSLVQQGIPAVIGMQFEISDDAAITFSREFYAALAEHYPVDAALAEARKAIFAESSGVEWGTPVLYLRAPDGRIFDIEQTSVAADQVLSVASAAPMASPPVQRPALTPVSDSRVVLSPGAPAPSEKPGQVQRVPRRANIPWLWVGGGLAAAIVIVLLLWILSGPGKSAPVVTEKWTPTPTANEASTATATAIQVAAVPQAATLTNSPNPTATSIRTLTLPATPTKTSSPTATRPRVALYRYYNAASGNYFYTTDENELTDPVKGDPLWQFDWLQGYVYTQQVPGTVPLYHYYNAQTGQHFYTTDFNELGNGSAGYTLDYVLAYVYDHQVPGTVPFNRYVHVNTSQHFYTPYDDLNKVRNGSAYKFEWIQCYIYSSMN